jgi:hypothetical protein
MAAPAQVMRNELAQEFLRKPDLSRIRTVVVCTKKQISPRMNTDDTDLQTKNGPIKLFRSV